MPKLLDRIAAQRWRSIEARLERGELPELYDIAHALRGGTPLPPTVKDHIADILEGKINQKRKRGRKPSPAKEFWRRFYKARIEDLRRAIKRLERIQGRRYSDHRGIALEKMAAITGKPVSTIDKIIYPRKRRH
jgi:hypothetical protein